MADNRIAYGLAKKYGIDTDGMSPKEVWEALAKKGVKELGGHRDEVYYKSAEELKEQQLQTLPDKEYKTKAARNDFSKEEEPLSEEENRQLNEYKVPRAPIVRQQEDAEKWARYDKDYETYKAKEPKITEDMDMISEKTGMPLIGRDFRLKSKGSYDRKVNDKRLKGEYKPLGDVVRYTFQHSMENAPQEINTNLEELRKIGYKVVAIDNKWKDDGAYNGINVDVISPSGVPMEIQYMTYKNQETKEKFHRYYEISRDKRTPANIKGLADRKMRELAKLWEIPKGIEEV